MPVVLNSKQKEEKEGEERAVGGGDPVKPTQEGLSEAEAGEEPAGGDSELCLPQEGENVLEGAGAFSGQRLPGPVLGKWGFMEPEP